MMKNKISTFIILLTLFYVAVNAQAPISTAVLGGTGTEIINDYFRDAAGNQYITGSFEGIVDFDQTTGTYNLTSLNSGQDLFIAKYSSGNVLKFAKSIGGLYNDEGTGIAVDTKGNILVSGYFMDIVDFDPGAGVVNLNSQINPDAFLLKLDTAGNFVYVKQTQGTGEVLTKGVQLDLDGNAYLAGRFNGPCNFDPGATNFTLNGSVAGDPAIFFAKYDSSGILKFAKEINGSGLDILNDFYIDNNKEIYLTGYFQNSTDFDPTLSTSNLNALGGQDAFFAKYSSTGNLVFAKQLSGAFSEEGYSITTDASNNIIVAGSFTGTVDFDPGTGSNPITASSSFSIFLSKFDSNGNLIFANGFGEGRPKALACDQYSNIYMAGYYDGVFDFDPSTSTVIDTSLGGNDMFITRYQSDGSYGFSWRMGGSSGDEISDILIDLTSGIYVCGNFYGGVSFNSTSNTVTNTSMGSSDIFFAKYPLYNGIEVKQGVFPIVDFFGNYYFGTVAVGSSIGPKTFSIKNIGIGILNLTGTKMVYLFGQDSANFLLDTTLTQRMIGPGQTTTFNLSFSPTSTSIKSSTIRIQNNGSLASNYSFHLNGNSEPEIDIKTNAQVSIPNGDSFSFGNLNIGTSSTLQFYVANSGTDTLNLTAVPRVRIAGLNASDFIVTSLPIGFQLGVGVSYPFSVKFAPLDTGIRSAQLIIESNDLDEYYYVVNLNGTGAAGVLKVFYNGNEVIKNSVLYLDTLNATSTKNFLFNLQNYGNITLNLTGTPIAYINYANNDFNLNFTGTLNTLAPGANTSFTLITTPDSAGNYLKTITIPTNGSGLYFSFQISFFARDTIRPKITSFYAATADGTYGVGNEIELRPIFNEPVIIIGNPTFHLNSGGIANLYRRYQNLSIYDFLYTVGPTDSTLDLGIFDSLSLSLNNGTITDTSGNPLYPYLPAPSFTGDNIIISPSHPTAILTTDATYPDQINSFNVNVNFNYEMFGFDTSDIYISNAVLKNLVPLVNGRSYTFELTPIDTGSIIVYIKKDGAKNSSGINNSQSNKLNIHALIDLQRKVWSQGWVNRLHFNKKLTDALNPYQLKTVIDSSNNYFLVGSLIASGDFNPLSGIDSVNSNQTRGILLSKYDENGLLLWVKMLQSSTSNDLRDAACDQLGNLYIVGAINDTIDLDPGVGVAQLTAEGLSDGFLAKYDPNGNYLWSIKIGNALDVYGTGVFQASDFITGISIDQNNDLIITGSFRGTIDFDPGPGTSLATSVTAGNAFFAKYTNSGVLIYAKPFNTLQGFTRAWKEKQLAVTTDKNNNIYLAGKFSSTVDLDPGIGVQSFTSISHTSFFIAKYNSAGDYIFAKQMQGTNSNPNSVDLISDIKVDNQNRIFICGVFASLFDFNPDAPVNSLNNTNQFNTNIFIAGYDSNGGYRFAKSCGRGGSITNYGYHKVHELALDSQSRIYFVGTYDQYAADFLGKTLNTWGYQGGWSGYDSYLAIADSSGNYLYAYGFQILGLYDCMTGISIDKNGKPLLTGIIDYYCDFDMRNNSKEIMNCPTASSLVNIKYNNLETSFLLKQATLKIDSGDVYNFGTITVGGSSGNKTFTISNIGYIKLFLTNSPKIVISGANASDFVITQNTTASSLEEGISTTFSINFIPTATGIRTATITIPNSDPAKKGFSFTINGGTDSEIDILENAVSIPSNGTFIFSPTNQFATTQNNFTIENSGIGTLQLTGNYIMSLSGANPNDFSIDTISTDRTINASSTTSFSLRFKPTSIGNKSAILTILNNDPNEATYIINLSGIAFDTEAPKVLQVTSSMPNGYYNAYDTLMISVIFNEDVNASGNSTISLNSGGTANFISGSGTNILNYRYVILPGENNSDLNYTTINSLQLVAGTINDLNSNIAQLTLPIVSSLNSLGGSKNLVVDTENPFATLNSAPGPYLPGINFNSTIQFNETVIGFVSSDINLTNATLNSFTSDNILVNYSFNLTPLAIGPLTLSIPSAVALDSAGNLNNTYSTTLNVTSGLSNYTITENQSLVYPNPTHEIINILNPPTGIIQIIDYTGKVLKILNFGSKKLNQISLNVDDLPQGIYLIQSKVQTLKFIKN